MSVLQQKLDILFDACVALCTPEEGQKLLLELMEKDASIEKLQIVVAKFDVNFGDDHFTNPLFIACHKAKAHYVKFLVDNGADVNKVSIHGSTAIMYSYQQGDFDSYLYLLLKGCPTKTDKFSIKNYPCTDKQKMQKFMEKMSDKMIDILVDNKKSE